jgi:transcriptional regulator GlxA family with amidase domain
MVAETSESTRREYAARMNRVVDHIQDHLADPLDLGRLAAIACFSPFHFHRLFRASMGRRYRCSSTGCVWSVRLSYWSSIA